MWLFRHKVGVRYQINDDIGVGAGGESSLNSLVVEVREPRLVDGAAERGGHELPC